LTPNHGYPPPCHWITPIGWGAVKELGVFDTLGVGGNIGGSAFLGNVARGSLSSALNQGVATAAGLQNKFDWAGVATAGIGAGAAGFIGARVGGGSFANHAATNTASAIANAATRSALTGSNFGDNIIAAIPDVIAQTIGGVIGDGMEKGKALKAAAAQRIDYGNPDDVYSKAPYDPEGDGHEITSSTEAGIPSPPFNERNGEPLGLTEYIMARGYEMENADWETRQDEINYFGGAHFSETVEGKRFVLGPERQATIGYLYGWKFAHEKAGFGQADGRMREFYGIGLTDKNYGVGFQAIADGYNDAYDMIRAGAGAVVEQSGADFAKLYVTEAVTSAAGGFVFKRLYQVGKWLSPQAKAFYYSKIAPTLDDAVAKIGGMADNVKTKVNENFEYLKTGFDDIFNPRKLRFETKETARKALDGPQGVAANRFFRDAGTNKTPAQDFMIADIADGGKRFEFTVPSRNPGYRKIFVQEVDVNGSILKEYKDTMGPKGLFERKWNHGGK
jgi:hypothetical protein